jgi:isocitrate dehydrogenase
VQLLDAVGKAGFDAVKTEGLYTFNGERAFSLAQGQ